MSRAPVAIAVAALLAGCTIAPPAGPSVLALPASGKGFAQFQSEDATCRSYALGQSGVGPASDDANRNAVGSAAIGTLIGAGLGAALGAAAGNVGAGAAIGAGSGLLIGGSSGAGNARASAYGVQQRYDIAYTQCQYANGNSVQSAPGAPRGYVVYPQPGYAQPAYPPPAYPPPGYPPPRDAPTPYPY